MISRRDLLLSGLVAAPVMLGVRALAQPPSAIESGLADLEKQYGGRLGVCALNTATGARIGRRADERFALCSTAKLLSVALVLSRVDRGEENLDRRIIFSKANLVTYSPATEKRVGEGGMALAEICEAALTLSDNTAANLMLDSFGGPQAVTAFARSLGDDVTRLDRRETELNEATPGDPRDTTTPSAMLDDIRKLVLGDALSPASRQRLAAWMIANTTGDKRFRAGVPAGWRVGDKTGTGDHAATNDVGILWPPGGAPIILTGYFAESPADVETRGKVLSEVARLVVAL